MTMHGHQPEGSGAFSVIPTTGSGVKTAAPSDPARALEEAVRAARASSHARRLDSATQSALNAFAGALAALTDYARVRDAELADMRARIAALEARESTRVHHDP